MQQKLLQKKNVSQVPNFFAETNHFLNVGWKLEGDASF
jgi:hypothetical protein